MRERFNINNKKYYIENIFCTIDIYNIENYLKRIENIKNNQNHKIEIFIVPNTHIYNKIHLNYAIYITYSKFIDKINISKNRFTEMLLTLNCSDQINKISKNWYLKKGENNYFINIVSNKIIDKKKKKEIIKELDIKVIRKNKYNKENALSFYKIERGKKEINKIIEKMTTSYLKN
ncbi:MAG: KEOPS complex subunit Cgi121 [Candidatus ainarchaeum sp.]|nr:KEOPS complex subunit Cgi121 [Candidatus ainarchaeum sp.]MDD3975739.1 KEOPS complex subunit Cgi121 [Candidatus ainarchaeum sp.]